MSGKDVVYTVMLFSHERNDNVINCSDGFFRYLKSAAFLV